MKFTDLNLHESLQEGIAASNYEETTSIQTQVIPLILEGRDIIASAQTGTGKTAAFLLPLLHKILTTRGDEQEHHVNAMIIVPTRELAVQIGDHLEGLSYFTNISSISVYGGGDGPSFVQEKQALSTGVDIVVCTPGKMISHINMGYVKLKQLQWLVLDEADRMLDMGFIDDIMRIIHALPAKRQTLLFSATMPHKIRALAKKILINPAEINIAISKPPEKIRQRVFTIHESQKIPMAQILLKDPSFKSILVFCSKKTQVKALTSELKKSGLDVAEIHSDLEQSQREEVLRKFTAKRIPILIATDILSRGIDIDHIDLVLNFDLPNDGEDYVHRVGRTARAESDGNAFTFVTPKEMRKLAAIELLLGNTIPRAKVPEQLPKPLIDHSPRKKPQRRHK